MKYLYPLLLLAEFVLVIAMVYVTAGLDGTPEIIARIGHGLCFMAVALTSWKASQVRRRARDDRARDGQPRPRPAPER